jgi:hypothetical protein
MPAGLLLTVPLPVPDFVTLMTVDDASMKVAVTLWAVAMLTEQEGALPEQAPLQPKNT